LARRLLASISRAAENWDGENSARREATRACGDADDDDDDDNDDANNSSFNKTGLRAADDARRGRALIAALKAGVTHNNERFERDKSRGAASEHGRLDAHCASERLITHSANVTL